MTLRRSLILLPLTCASCANTRTSQTPAGLSSPPTSASTERPTATEPPSVFRDAFTLTLNVDKQNEFEAKFDPVPYTHHGVVYLFKGDHFGFNLDAHGVATYEPDVAKADVEVEFSQGTDPSQPSSIMLVISNHFDRTVSMNALMTVPENEFITETTIRTVHAGLTNYESWPHPIKQLVLKDFRLET